ncbi:hypothetical protein G7061_06680 [Erysipelothrix sp. HDW6B]|uniref:hypothetical protein n=1 Tax=Erysipelothrix sp. HDW6B TaxID=2714929 RepID=UPI00140C7E66|nr:hypothetical protein [Erysipelothrix sp. HDW6B]QIK86315.1 hypothetical protein G7061_06680 [Erysipelothrix sp. HDW6B]
MKRRYKALLIVLTCLGVIATMGIIDYKRIGYDKDTDNGFSEPIFAIRVGDAGGGFTDEYRGLLYWIRVGTDGKEEPLEGFVYKCIDFFPVSLIPTMHENFCSKG